MVSAQISLVLPSYTYSLFASAECSNASWRAVVEHELSTIAAKLYFGRDIEALAYLRGMSALEFSTNPDLS
jgi:hypothetical protein